MDNNNIVKKNKATKKTVSVAVHPSLYNRLVYLKENLHDVDINRTIEKHLFSLVEQLEKKYSVYEIKKDPEICPLCGNKVALKNGKFGKFLSCFSNECSFTKSLEKNQ